MRKILFILLTVFSVTTLVCGPMIATTDDGRKVILYENRTWDWAQSGSPSLRYNLTGQWDFSWTLGIFDETMSAQITHGQTSITLTWKDTFGTTNVTGRIVSSNELTFNGKSFYNGEITFKATVIDNNTLKGTVSSGGAFPKTGNFTAKKR
ncbi:MAG TPA: hypothetical protein PLN20_03935 [Thermotogota bacterium]|nr:hypothetical protein [Thermotogota bacterium]HNY82040.1 hypothetical protein [Thermotogota bacterium]HOH12785.1 hypothetical protein [Thermotogota bacterium]HPG98429.1 hypothetical protein [Thermotogota bacterium]HPN28846.1 hypothetical protein [Thermotogota bacterium]